MPTQKILKPRSVNVKAKKWGNSLGFRINSTIAREIHIEDGSELSMTVAVDRKGLVLRRIESTDNKPFFTEKELLADANKKSGHVDELAVVLPGEMEY